MVLRARALAIVFLWSGVMTAASAAPRPGGLMTMTDTLRAAAPGSPPMAAILSSSQQTIPDSKAAFSVAGFEFRIVKVAFDTTAMGFVPERMGFDDRLMFVEFELLAGRREDFKSLPIIVSDGAARKYKAVVLAEGGTMKMLAPMVLKDVASGYRPGDSNIAWAYIVPKSGEDFVLNFPSGEAINLAPLITEKKDRDKFPNLVFILAMRRIR